LAVFAALAETLSFRAAAERMGVSRSAVSQAVRRLEDRMGIALVQRTTRSVRLTEAGARLHEAVGPAVSDLAAAAEALGEVKARPSGRLRIAVSSIAESFLSARVLASFLAAHPEVALDVTISDEEFDVVAEGFDAGVRLGEVIERDMVAVPVSGEQRQLVVGAPSYVERRGIPRHPRDLPSHDCIGWRPHHRVAPYRWEFTEEGRDFDVDVEPFVTTNDMALMIRMACAGAGLTFGMEESFRAYLTRGELVPMLEEFCPPFAGFYLYFPSRRNMPLKLRALLDHLRAARPR
jgi:DNA-binding transcriptional LysR family regulator